MREIVSKRRTHSKVFDLGGGRFKVRSSRAPLHHVRDGKMVDIDTTPRAVGRLLEITEAPYRLKIEQDRPAYLYTNGNGRSVEVELIECGGMPVRAGRAVHDAGTVVWKGVSRQTDLAFRPLRQGIEALMILYGPEAPRRWKWRVRGARELLLQPKGHDAEQKRLELTHHYDAEVLTVEWTGRAASRQALRQGKGHSEKIAYPVVVDPTVNEAISDGSDDVYSYSHFLAGQGFVSGAQYLHALFNSQPDDQIYWAGLRFRGLALPQGATITSATLTLDLLSAFSGPDADVFGDDVDDASAWSGLGSVRNITKTTASVNITPGSTGSYPIGVTGIVQEIVDRTGWASGNNMRFALFPNSGGIGLAALEHATRSEAQLDIEYEAVGGAGIAPKMMHYRRLRV